MLGYIFRRLLLVIPTLFGIMAINFIIVQAAPGGPVERMIARIKHADMGATERISSMGGELSGMRASSVPQSGPNSQYMGAQGVDPNLIKQIEKMYGFDKPPLERFVLMVKNYLRFDFGKSYFRDESVTKLIMEKMPVSISLGLWTTLLAYLISIPLGIIKAVKDGERFDVWSSTVIIIGYAIPSFLFAIFLIILFSGGNYWNIFPMRGLVSDNWHDLSTWGKISDYLWHMVLPVTAMTVGGFASLTMLTKNSFLDEIGKQYVVTARAKGLNNRQVLFNHIFRNAMLIVISGFPAAFIGVLFKSALLIEIVFSLDGMGLLGFEAAINRDYPVMFGMLYIFTLIGLVLNLIGDLTYVLVDPRIDFERRGNA
ncbi:MAG TPA: microcin C ABC transporter permease YejB [Rickettsiales bacterium]|nr:microcin C ABC transporter permease YejB [Rickettsiales bacterium]